MDKLKIAQALHLVPRKDEMDALVEDIAKHGRCDAQLAAIWAEKLRHTYTKVLEVKYPELRAANGEVLPIDTSVDPAANEWEYYQVDQAGYADWIDDDGGLMPSGSITATRHVGVQAEMGHEYDLTVFELERAALAIRNGGANVQLSTLKQKNAKRVHDVRAQYAWLFGDVGKGMYGLCNHPNITKSMAQMNSGATSRLWANKTVDEIATDIADLVDRIATQTLGAYFGAKIWLPRHLFHILRNRRLGAGDGTLSLLSWMKDRYKGDESGQGRVTFEILNECASNLRAHPVSGADESGISGDFLICTANLDKEEAAFIRSRPFTQRPPQEIRFKVHHLTHSKIGGCKLQAPLAVHRMDFGTT